MTALAVQKSETYRRALAGEKIDQPAGKRTALCIDRGKLVKRVGSCRGNDLVVCDRFGSVVVHNRECQTCLSFVADGT
jgi:formylmethanofuran dehydrogenase subunit D